jgi:sirohydrochlorin cobaltochelatase
MSGNYFPAWPIAMAALIMAFIIPAQGWAYERTPQRSSIVLAAFGTTEPKALSAILHVEAKVKAAFPDCDVFLGFTANRVRDVWRERAKDAAWQKANPGVPAAMYTISNPLAVMGRIQDQGSRTIFVQSLHITNGTEFEDQEAIVKQLALITAFQESKRPFPYLSMGASALGQGGARELDRAAAALKGLAEEAKSKNAALVFMGHGNDHKDVQSYRDFAAAMSKKYGQPVFMGLVEGKPGFDDLLAELKKAKVQKTLLVPLMLVAGDHAINDMAGDDDESLKSRLQSAGFEVEAILQGLGNNDDWANIYVENIRAQIEAFQKAAGK